jgi:hypothetical protein
MADPLLVRSPGNIQGVLDLFGNGLDSTAPVRAPRPADTTATSNENRSATWAIGQPLCSVLPAQLSSITSTPGGSSPVSPYRTSEEQSGMQARMLRRALQPLTSVLDRLGRISHFRAIHDRGIYEGLHHEQFFRW